MTTEAAMSRIRKWKGTLHLPVVFLALIQMTGMAAFGGPAGSDAGSLYLLTGTPTRDSMYGFPVSLYTVSGGRLALVRQVSSGMSAIADDLVGHLYVFDVGMHTLSVIHENAPLKVDDILPPEVNPDLPPDVTPELRYFSFYDPTFGAISGPDVPASAVFAGGNSPTTWRVTRIFGDAIPGKPRLAEGSWDLYRYFRYEGPGGGPYYYILPGGTIEDGRIMMPYTLGGGQTELGPVPPFLPPEAGVVAGYSNRPRAADLIADTERFFAFCAPLPSVRLEWPRTVYALNKATGRWSVIKVPFIDLRPRLFEPWLATRVEKPNPENRESPGEDNERANEEDTRSPTGPVRESPGIRGMYSRKAFMPGSLLLQNLLDGRKITIETGQQDSEIIDVRSDGLVLYRVNDSIFSAQIEGHKLSAPTVVVKDDDDVPEVHWAFWSNAEVKAKAEPKTNSADQSSAGQ
jgi:hypothetical protein